MPNVARRISLSFADEALLLAVEELQILGRYRIDQAAVINRTLENLCLACLAECDNPKMLAEIIVAAYVADD